MTSNATVAVRTQEEQTAPSKWRAAARQFGVVWSNTKARIGIIILAVFVVVAIAAALLAPYGASQNGFARSADATWAHWMGTTAAGEDVLSRSSTAPGSPCSSVPSRACCPRSSPSRSA
ncbi:hypothetical protein P9139_06925 [Curtobacterium flaccumfaciens]|nr:hypothetical protein P9139_06925 [Curtobacterium flaccumfaciens]